MEGEFEGKEKPKLQLYPPTKEIVDSFLEAVHEFGVSSEYSQEQIEEISKDPEAWIDRLKKTNDRNNVLEGRVPSSLFWAIEDGKYIGRIQLRHELNDKLRNHGGHIGYAVRPSERNKGYATRMLAAALEKARDIGLTEVLMTTMEDNVPSRKVIEANGGKLIDCSVVEGHTIPRCRYSITIEDKD